MATLKATKKYTPSDFDEERGRRTMFSELHLDDPKEDARIADQLIIVGSNTDSTPSVLYQYPSAELKDFNYELLVEFCFPAGVNRVDHKEESTEEMFDTVKKARDSHKNVTRFFTFYFTSNTIGCTRYAICFSKTRILLDDTIPLTYKQDEVIYVLLTSNTRFSLHVSCLEALLDLDESIEITKPNALPCPDFTTYLQSYFSIPPKHTKPVRLPWKTDPLFDQPANLCRCLFFRVVPLEYQITLLSAVLLEHKVLVKSRHRCLVSSAIGFLRDAVSPFCYESPLISVLSPTLIDLLDSPTPLIIGCTELPEEVPDKTYIYDIDNKKMQYTGEKVVLIPRSSELINEMKEIFKFLRNKPTHTAVQCFKKHSGIIEWALVRVNTTLKLLFESFEDYCISSVGVDPITLFMKEEFVNACSDDCKEFMKRFVETQMFENYKTRQLIQLDKLKRDKLKK